MTPAKAGRLRREAQGRREERRKRWWALAVIVFIIIAVFVGLAIVEKRLRDSNENEEKRGSDSFGNAHHD